MIGSFFSLRNGTSFKGPIDLQRLFIYFISIHLLNSLFGFFELSILDKGIALGLAGPSVGVQIQAFDIAEVTKSIENIILHDFFLEVGHDNNPALHRYALFRRVHCWGLGFLSITRSFSQYIFQLVRYYKAVTLLKGVFNHNLMLFKFYQFSRNASWQKNNQPRGLIGKFMRALPKIQSGLIMRMELKLGQKCILYNTFFSMSEGSRNSSQRRLSEQSDDQSQESFQFQQLKTGENQSISKAFDLVEDSNLSKSSEYKNQQRIKIYEAQLQDKINMLEKQLKVRQQQLEKQTKSKNQYYRLYQKLLQQSSQLTEKNQISVMENGQLKDINLQLKKLCKQLQEENQGYVQKVNFLLKKIQLQKEDCDSKFNVIRRNLQALTKVPLKNVENQNMVKLVASKFVQMEKILNKLTEMDQMIIQKAPKSRTAPENTDILQEKFNIAQKIQNLLVKQQSKINALKQYNFSLEQQLNEAKKNSNSISTGLGKIFNPVMKFCKAEEQKQSEIKKKKENI